MGVTNAVDFEKITVISTGGKGVVLQIHHLIDFIDRCMGDAEAVADYPDADQRFAVCNVFWDEKQEGYKPTAEMAQVAERALEWRREYGRGGTEVGVARARDIANRANLSGETVARMRSFFARHGTNRSDHYDDKEPDGGPPRLSYKEVNIDWEKYPPQERKY